MWKSLDKYREAGFIILRLGIGGMFILHGYGMLKMGSLGWEKIGGSLSYFGINFGHQFFGLLASLSEFLGGICLILGLFFRPACCFLFITMVVATSFHFHHGDGLQGASHALELGILFLSLIFIGPGQLSLDEKIKK